MHARIRTYVRMYGKDARSLNVRNIFCPISAFTSVAIYPLFHINSLISTEIFNSVPLQDTCFGIIEMDSDRNYSIIT